MLAKMGCCPTRSSRAQVAIYIQRSERYTFPALSGRAWPAWQMQSGATIAGSVGDAVVVRRVLWTEGVAF